jgi:hypothetical protein
MKDRVIATLITDKPIFKDAVENVSLFLEYADVTVHLTFTGDGCVVMGLNHSNQGHVMSVLKFIQQLRDLNSTG